MSWIRSMWKAIHGAVAVDECPICETDKYLVVIGGCVTCHPDKGGCGLFSACSSG